MNKRGLGTGTFVLGAALSLILIFVLVFGFVPDLISQQKAFTHPLQIEDMDEKNMYLVMQGYVERGLLEDAKELGDAFLERYSYSEFEHHVVYYYVYASMATGDYQKAVELLKNYYISYRDLFSNSYILDPGYIDVFADEKYRENPTQYVFSAIEDLVEGDSLETEQTDIDFPQDFFPLLLLEMYEEDYVVKVDGNLLLWYIYAQDYLDISGCDAEAIVKPLFKCYQDNCGLENDFIENGVLSRGLFMSLKAVNVDDSECVDKLEKVYYTEFENHLKLFLLNIKSVPAKSTALKVDLDDRYNSLTYLLNFDDSYKLQKNLFEELIYLYFDNYESRTVKKLTKYHLSLPSETSLEYVNTLNLIIGLEEYSSYSTGLWFDCGTNLISEIVNINANLSILNSLLFKKYDKREPGIFKERKTKNKNYRGDCFIKLKSDFIDSSEMLSFYNDADSVNSVFLYNQYFSRIYDLVETGSYAPLKCDVDINNEFSFSFSPLNTLLNDFVDSYSTDTCSRISGNLLTCGITDSFCTKANENLLELKKLRDNNGGLNG